MPEHGFPQNNSLASPATYIVFYSRTYSGLRFTRVHTQPQSAGKYHEWSGGVDLAQSHSPNFGVASSGAALSEFN